MNSKTIRIVAAVLGLVIILWAVNAGRGGESSGPATKRQVADAPAKGAGPKGAIVVDVAYSPEKERFFTAAFADFNARKVKVDGTRIYARGTVVSSGKSFDELKAGRLKPVIWSPSSSLWGRLLTHVADVPWVPEKNPSFARTPLVIAIWEQQARALGWPKKQLGWADVVAEARNPRGFAAYGHPEWGSFRLGQTNPDFSTSGLSATVAEYYAAVGKTEGLRPADVKAKAVREQVQDIQSSIVHYGDTTLFFAEQLAKRGPGYASAVAMEETTLVDFNTRLRPKGGQKLVAIYPKEGTFFSDNPLITLDAPWVSSREQKAAAKLVDYLTGEKVQRRVGSEGFRPATDDIPVAARLDEQVGVDPTEPKRRLSLPSPEVLALVREQWHEDRKPADIVVVLDTSGSMLDEDRLVQAQQGVAKFIDYFGPRDRAALVTFSDVPTVALELSVMTPGARSRMRSSVLGLYADGGTAVYDATARAVELLEAEGDPKHIRAVVVLTDGIDNKSTTPLGSLVDALDAPEAGAGQPVRVFTIAYGSDASVDDMARIADASGGRPYVGDPATIESVYTSISSFF